jgi:HSP20 family protein
MLLRFDPFRYTDPVAQPAGPTPAPRSFPLDAYRRGDTFILQFDLPGVDASSIDLTADRNVLTVKGERRFPRQDGDEIVVSERPQGEFTRQLILGETLDTERISARYDDGVLTLHIPLAERAKPRKVEISRGEGAQTNGAGSEAAGVEHAEAAA